MERRKICGVVEVSVYGQSFKVHLYDATDWPDRPGALPGRFRLQQGRTWLKALGQRFEFLTLEQIFDLAQQQVCEDHELSAETLAINPPPRPDFVAGQRVRWMRSRYPAHERPGILTTIKTPPFLAAGNSWKVFLSGGSRYLGTDEPVPCSELQPI